MNRIILVGAPEPWERFARPILEEEEKIPTVSFAEERDLLDSTLAGTITSEDLMVLSPTKGRLPSAELAPMFHRLGPVRVLVVDGRFDYMRMGDAVRGCAVGYEAMPWNREKLIELVETYDELEPPDRSAIDRRFGPWRTAI